MTFKLKRFWIFAKLRVKERWYFRKLVLSERLFSMETIVKLKEDLRILFRDLSIIKTVIYHYVLNIIKFFRKGSRMKTNIKYTVHKWKKPHLKLKKKTCLIRGAEALTQQSLF